jgi:hypothetical protein
MEYSVAPSIPTHGGNADAAPTGRAHDIARPKSEGTSCGHGTAKPKRVAAKKHWSRNSPGAGTSLGIGRDLSSNGVEAL